MVKEGVCLEEFAKVLLYFRTNQEWRNEKDQIFFCNDEEGRVPWGVCKRDAVFLFIFFIYITIQELGNEKHQNFCCNDEGGRVPWGVCKRASLFSKNPRGDRRKIQAFDIKVNEGRTLRTSHKSFYIFERPMRWATQKPNNLKITQLQ